MPPSYITYTRSVMPTISDSSLEAYSTHFPAWPARPPDGKCPASRQRQPLWSAHQNIHIRVDQQPFADCHLLLVAPDRFLTRARSLGVLIPSDSIISLAACFSLPKLSQDPHLEKRDSTAAVKLTDTGSSTKTPSRRRSSGTSAMPCETASCGERMRSFSRSA